MRHPSTDGNPTVEIFGQGAPQICKMCSRSQNCPCRSPTTCLTRSSDKMLARRRICISCLESYGRVFWDGALDTLVSPFGHIPISAQAEERRNDLPNQSFKSPSELGREPSAKKTSLQSGPSHRVAPTGTWLGLGTCALRFVPDTWGANIQDPRPAFHRYQNRETPKADGVPLPSLSKNPKGCLKLGPHLGCTSGFLTLFHICCLPFKQKHV